MRECFFLSSLVFISWDWETKENGELRRREGGKGRRAKKVKWKARTAQMRFHGATQTPHVVLVNWKQRFARCPASAPLSTHMADCKQRAIFFLFSGYLWTSNQSSCFTRYGVESCWYTTGLSLACVCPEVENESQC